MSSAVPSPYDLRKYLEQHRLRADQMLNLASPALNGGLPTNQHWEWLNVLLTRAFSPDAKTGVGIRAKDEVTLINSITPLIVRPKFVDYLEKESILDRSGSLLKQVQRTSTFDELVRNQLPAKRALHSLFHQNSTSPELLTRNVQLNIEMHDKFEKLYGEVIKQMQDLSEQLRQLRVNPATIPEESSETSVVAAMEFAVKPAPWVTGDYSKNIANLQTVIRMRDMLQRAVIYFGMSLPSVNPTTPVTLADPAAFLHSTPTPPPGPPTRTPAPAFTIQPTPLPQGADPNLAHELETEIQACINYLTQTMANSGTSSSTVRVIRLTTGSFLLTSWEAAAFEPTANVPEWQVSYLVREGRKLLQRSIALLAVIEQRRPKPTENIKLTPGQRSAAQYYLGQITEVLNTFDRFLQRSATSATDIEILSNLRNTRRKIVMTQTQLKQTIGIHS